MRESAAPKFKSGHADLGDEADVDEAAVQAAADAVDMDRLVGRAKILIVEDTPIQAKKLKYDLENFGFSVVWAENGWIALDLLRESPGAFDLVITDYQMPELDGLELLRAIRDDSRLQRLPVAVLSTLIEDDLYETALMLNAADVMQKPYVPIALKLRVQRLIAMAEYEQVLADENTALSNQLIAKNQELERNYESLMQANIELMNLQNELIVASKAASLGVLSSGIAHEINNPLAIITSFADQLIEAGNQDAPLDLAQARRIGNKILDSAKRVAKIVQSMQELSDGSQRSGVRERVVMSRFLENLRFFYDEYARRHGIEVVYELDAADDAVLAHEGLLQQAILNLIYNALDAMEQSPKRRLTVSTRLRESRLAVAIEDTGFGIPAENLPKIFDPFFTTKAPNKGAGLGLSLVYRFVQDSGGEISCQSSSNGTKFEVLLPLC